MNYIRESEYRVTMTEKVLPFLFSVRTDGEMNSFDGRPLHWVSFRCPDPVRSVVMLHGFTESTEKYSEMIWYFLNSGSNVLIFDQRGHGKSYRHVEDMTLTHVNHFDDYVTDFEYFVRDVVPHDLPLRLFSHSMGGAVAGLYLEKNPDVFPKAVFSSPMIAPARGGIPLGIAKFICRSAILLGKAEKRLFLSSPYPGKESFENACDTSEERFSFYEAIKRKTPYLQNYSPTYRWTLESLNVTARLLRKGEPEKIKSEVLLINAGLDDVVLAPEQEAFISRISCGRLRTFENAKHEIFYSSDDVLFPYVDEILSFLA